MIQTNHWKTMGEKKGVSAHVMELENLCTLYKGLVYLFEVLS